DARRGRLPRGRRSRRPGGAGESGPAARLAHSFAVRLRIRYPRSAPRNASRRLRALHRSFRRAPHVMEPAPERDPRPPRTGSVHTVTRTYSPKASEITHDWVIIDATDIVLGRLASHAAALLRGKHKATFAPHLDSGDFVIIVNADKVALTGSKRDQKLAYRHSGYPGGLSAVGYAELLEKHPTRAVEKAVRGMLPKNALGRA